MVRIPNKQVVKELKDGDPRGCSHLVELYQERLVGEGVTVFGLVFEDAEELVSDVLLTVVEKVNDFQFKRGDGDFHLWVMTIFRNRVRDLVRHQALTEGLVERFDERDPDDDEYSNSERAVIGEIVRRYQDSLRDGDTLENGGSGDRSTAARLQAVVETLERMESWERVLLRCRALDVPYEEIASYTGKPVKQLKVYHARVKKKFVKMLTQQHPEFVPQPVGTETDEA